MALSDLGIVGTVLALAVAILLLSGLALYVAFRVRETLRDEKGGSARAVKVAFLIGLLFLSGGMFYFFASGFNASGGGSSTQGTTSITTPSSVSSTTGSTSLSSSTSTTTGQSTSTSSMTSSSTSTSSSATTTTTTTTTPTQGVSVSTPSCAGDRVAAGSTFYCSFSISNSGSATYGSGTVVSGGDFSKFTFLGCTETVNGVASSCTVTSGNSIAIGDVVPGTIVVTLTVQAPSQQGQNNNCVLTLSAVNLPFTDSPTFTIQVTA